MSILTNLLCLSLKSNRRSMFSGADVVFCSFSFISKKTGARKGGAGTHFMRRRF
jgi:hypothetical protein